MSQIGSNYGNERQAEGWVIKDDFNYLNWTVEGAVKEIYGN